MATATVFSTRGSHAKIRFNTSSLQRRTMRVPEAAAYIGVSDSKMRQLAWNGEVPFIQEGKGYLMLFEKVDLDRWLEAHKVAC